MRVVLSVPDEDRKHWRDLFSAALPDAHIVAREPGAPVRPDAAHADYVIIFGPCATIFAEQRSPRAVFALSAGIGHLLALPDLPRGVPVIRLEDAGMAQQMIRYVLAAALRFLQRFDVYARQQAQASWEPHDPRSAASVRVGVMGLGVIGSQVAAALAAQGFEVRGYALSWKALPDVEVFAGPAGLDAFLEGLDILVSVLPSTPATAGVLKRDTLSRLADGAHVINIGRGTALVDDDLVALLEAGKLSGATLDVFQKEPLPPNHPFWSTPGIVVTPHVSGLTVPDAAVAQVVGKIAQLERGEAVSGIVAVERGY